MSARQRPQITYQAVMYLQHLRRAFRRGPARLQLCNPRAAGYGTDQMRANPTSLMGRLRRRLAMAAWAFALVIAGQSLLATLCLADGPAGSTATSIVAAEAHASTSLDGDPAHDALCWHAGSGGCHCSCAHASGLPVAATSWPLDHVGAASTAADPPAPYAAPLLANLRPPIA